MSTSKKNILARQLAEEIHSIGRDHDSFSLIRGTSPEESLILSIRKRAGELVQASGDSEVHECLELLTGELALARTFGILSENGDLGPYLA